MDPGNRDATLDRALEEERALVATLGGFSLEIAGARLVTHERIPVPRFNFVQDVRIAPERRTAFFERALDHYFQRALRPEIRIGRPVPAPLAASLRALQFVERSAPHEVLLAPAGPAGTVAAGLEVRAAGDEELGWVAEFLTSPSERAEVLRSIEVATRHPNPDERLVPIIAVEGGAPVGLALAHAYRGAGGVHAVATSPAARGRGVATSLVAGSLALGFPSGTPVTLHSEDPRLAAHLAPLGFEPLAAFTVFELPSTAELAFPVSAAATRPHWRPPKRGAPA